MIFDGVVATIVLLAPVTFCALFFVRAEYGRHADDRSKRRIPARVAWVVMEFPAVVLFATVYFLGDHSWRAAPLVLFAAWQVHYVNRTFIYPLRMRPGGRGMALSVMALGMLFQTLNGYTNARWISHFGDYAGSLETPRLWAGLAIFFAGWLINLRSDRILRQLRKPGEVGYAIPHGGLYRYVSCPNYLGEIIEWGGWALATASPPGVAFFAFTFANLAPRAWAHHRWYQAKFSDYPKTRRALIPFVF